MSYDFTMVTDTCPMCGHSTQKDYYLNYTYNVSPMFREAMGERGIDKLHGQLGEECNPILTMAINDMMSNPEKYKAMNPSNDWG